MQIKTGNYRKVLIIGNYVLKFPRIFRLKMAIERTFSELKIKNIRRKKWWVFTGKNYKLSMSWIRAGIEQNIHEYSLWKATKAEFLAKTYFGIGIMNIQKFETGEIPSDTELIRLFSRICKDVNYEIFTVDPHCIEPKNFVKKENGYKIIDYGDTGKESGLPFHVFLLRWNKVLHKAFKIDA